MLLLMWQAFRDAYQGKIGETTDANMRGDFALGIALTLANPFPVVFWLNVLPTLIATRHASLNPKDVRLFLAGFLISVLLWSLFMSSLIAWGRRFLTPAFFRLVNLVCGLALGFFALKLLWSTLMLLKG